MNLIKTINNLKKTNVSKKVNKRLNEFRTFRNKGNKEWFSELCFCILTANSKARTALKIQDELKGGGFARFNQDKIRRCIIKNKHRFHNNKTKYIIEARKYLNIKDLLRNKTSEEAREFLVKNIKGLGYKEASHFLRNVGYFDLAILDRHILNLLVENRLLEMKPDSLNKSNYLKIEDKFRRLSERLGMSMAELDLYMWYMKTGEVLK
ncbi:MAG: N-glycosylase/DNA lyase [Candidatus Nanoarchaeia archaeon]|nr:N-glycosylase/DNA lyase [Candidatus Nanoarchaeia archaeon]